MKQSLANRLCRKKLCEKVPALIGPWLVRLPYTKRNSPSCWCKRIWKGKIDEKETVLVFKNRLWYPQIATLQTCQSTYRKILSDWEKDKFVSVLHEASPAWVKVFQQWTKNPAILIHLYTPFGEHMVVQPTTIMSPFPGVIKIVIDDVILIYD